jgi:hypothetical protein
MKDFSDLERYIIYPARSGGDIISSSRAILYYLGDELAGDKGEAIEPFQSIDSQTDYIKLDDDYPFALPSPRVSLSGIRLGALVGSTVRDPITPNHPNYAQELESIFEYFSSLYNSSVDELLKRNS